MDGDTLKVILSRFDDIQEGSSERNKALQAELQSVQGALTEINKNLVGQEKCALAMERLRTDITTENEKIQCRLQVLEDRKRLADLTWNTVKDNNVLRAASIVLGLLVTGVYWGRINDAIMLWGVHAVLIGLTIVIIGSLSAWVTRRRTGKLASTIKKMLWWM